MIKNILKIIALTLLVLMGTSLTAYTKKSADISSIYLTWDNDDTATTMVVNVLTIEEPKNPRLIYGTAIQALNRDSLEVTNTDSRRIPSTPLFITRFSLKNLTPDTTYFFNYRDETHQVPPEQSFKTLPSTNKSVEFLQGGDLSASEDVARVANAAVTNNTMAYVIGGDIAYDNGVLSNYNLFLKWFGIMNRAMRTPDGRLVPLILAIGNHEVNGKPNADPLSRSPFYLNLFFQNEELSYFSRHLGAHTQLFVLDSGHLASHSGAQRDWLETELDSSTSKNKLAVYHVPLYPTYRDFDGSLSTAGRKHWLPLFDKYNLTLAMENHDHALKRTHMLKDNKIVSSDGTVYIGDGCWGVSPRPVKQRWYHHLTQSTVHIWRLTATATSITAEALNKSGTQLDTFTLENQSLTTKKTKPSPTYAHAN